MLYSFRHDDNDLYNILMYGYYDDDDDDYDDDPPSPIWKKLLLILACLAVGAATIFGLYKVILGSFTTDPVVEYAVPNIVGMTVEEDDFFAI